MLARNLKSVRGMRKKTKTCGLVERPKFEFDRGKIQKPSHGEIKLGKWVKYVLKNVF